MRIIVKLMHSDFNYIFDDESSIVSKETLKFKAIFFK